MSQEAKQGVRPSRIPQNLAAANQLIRGTDTVDIMLTIMSPMIVVTGLMYFNVISVIQMLGIGVGVFAINYVLYRYLPDQFSLWYWIRSVGVYLRSPSMQTKHGVDEAEDDIEIEYLEQNTGGKDPNGGMFDFIEVNEPTTDLTLVEEIDIENGIVKLCDGSFVAGVTVGGMGMLLADDEQRESAINQYERTLNTIQFPICVRGTSREFDITSIIDRYDNRLDDKDVERRPIMQRVMQSRKQMIQQEIKPLGMNNRQYEVIIRASYDDGGMNDQPFDFNLIAPDSPVGRWLRSKNIGIVADESVEEELAQAATDRAETVKKTLSGNRHLTVELASGDDLADSLRYCWRREPVEEGSWEPAAPLVTEDDSLTGRSTSDSMFSDLN
jgi:hypothetical protein